MKPRLGLHWATGPQLSSLSHEMHHALHCEMQEGGYTLFSLSAIKVVPRKRRMLFFGYKLPGTTAYSNMLSSSSHQRQS